MARRTFFSSHYERDVWRAGRVRNSWVTNDRQDAGFWDSAQWEEVKKKGDDTIHRWIAVQLADTSVTVVLIGAETSTRPYVDYEITESHKKGNGMLGIYIHHMKAANGRTDVQGNSPFSKWTFRDGSGTVVTYQTYAWVYEKGRDNLGSWIEAAATKAGR